MFRQAPPVLQTPQGVRRHTILHHGAYSRAQQLLISSAEGPNVRIQRVKEAHCGRKTQRLINSRTFLFFLIKRVATIIWQRLEKPSWRPASLTGQKKKKGAWSELSAARHRHLRIVFLPSWVGIRVMIR